MVGKQPQTRPHGAKPPRAVVRCERQFRLDRVVLDPHRQRGARQAAGQAPECDTSRIEVVGQQEPLRSDKTCGVTGVLAQDRSSGITVLRGSERLPCPTADFTTCRCPHTATKWCKGCFKFQDPRENGPLFVAHSREMGTCPACERRCLLEAQERQEATCPNVFGDGMVGAPASCE